MGKGRFTPLRGMPDAERLRHIEDFLGQLAQATLNAGTVQYVTGGGGGGGGSDSGGGSTTPSSPPLWRVDSTDIAERNVLNLKDGFAVLVTGTDDPGDGEVEVTFAVDADLQLNLRGLAAARPAAGTAGRTYFATDTNGGTLYRDTGAVWEQVAAGVTEAAPKNASYVTTAAESGLSGEQVLGTAVVIAGLLAARPLATAVAAGVLYLATDTNGGTLYRSDGTNWSQTGAGVDADGASSASALQAWRRSEILNAGTTKGEMQSLDGIKTGVTMYGAGRVVAISLDLDADLSNAGTDWYEVEAYSRTPTDPLPAYSASGLAVRITGTAGNADLSGSATGSVAFAAGAQLTVFDQRQNLGASTVSAKATLFVVLD